MKELLKKLAKYGATVLVAGVTGYCVASATLCSRVDKYVEEAYDKAAVKFRVDFEITCTHDGRPAEIASLFSKDEKFVSDKDEAQSVLDQKKGFSYSVDLRTCLDPELHFRCVGAEYDFKVQDSLSRSAYESLTISNYTNYTGGLFPSSHILVEDHNHDGFIDWVSVNDNVNNSQMLIRRDHEGNLTYNNVNEEGARQLYDLYTLKFNVFKIEHGIDRAILEYQPKLEVKELKTPPTTFRSTNFPNSG